MEHVDGEDKGTIVLYALSTCIWCRKTKEHLEGLGVAYDYIYVDLLEGDEQKEVMAEVKKWNPKGSFPTAVIKNEKCIVGHNTAQIDEALNGVSDEEVDNLYTVLGPAVERMGRHLNPDVDFTKALLKSLLINEKRY